MKNSFLLFCVLLIIFIPDLFAQDNYNHTAHQHLKRSMEHLLKGDYDSALKSINESLKFDRNSAISYIIRARAYFELGEMERAIADCTHVINIDRNSSTAYVIRGNAYVRKGDYNKAISDWESALRINPNIDEARQNIELARERMSGD